MSENKEWDNLVIQIARGDKSLAKIRINRSDIESLEKLHGSKGEIMEMMLDALAEQVKNQEVDGSNQA